MSKRQDRAASLPSPGPEVWEAYAIAHEKVLGVRGGTEAGAAEWLRQAALSGRVRARFSEAAIRMHEQTLALTSIRVNGPKSEAEAKLLAENRRPDPSDDFALGPASMQRPRIQHETEWHPGDLSEALAERASCRAGADPQRPGRTPEWPWSEVVAEVISAVALAGGPPAQEALVAEVQAAAQRSRVDGRRPSRARAQTFAKAVRDAWERRGPDAKK